MKQYPQILKEMPSFNAHVFDKIDGSNLRFEYSKKRGWYKYGTRSRLFDESDLVFGAAIPQFHTTLAEPLSQLFKTRSIEHAVIFVEYVGPSSFAGQHVKEEPHELIVIDASFNKQGLIDPKEFLKSLAPIVPTPAYLGYHRWNSLLIDAVHKGEFPGMSFEGVVGKSGAGTSRIMAKCKTYAWLTKVKQLYSAEDAERIIQS